MGWRESRTDEGPVSRFWVPLVKDHRFDAWLMHDGVVAQNGRTLGLCGASGLEKFKQAYQGYTAKIS